MRLNAFQKIIIWLVIAGVLSSSLADPEFFKPKTAYAQLVFDIPAETSLAAANVELGVINVSTAAIAGSAATHVAETIAEWAKRIAVQILKKTLLDRLVDRIIDWINGGNVKAKIVGDWKEFLKQAGKDAVGELAQEVGAGFLCSPFNLQVRITLQEPQRFTQRVTCTLDSIVRNIQDFYGDFRKGDWLAYQTQWQPQNNYYGATLIALDEADKREDAAVTAAQNEAVAGGGFLSSKECDAQGHCKIITPGKLVGDTVSEILVKTPISTILSAQDIDAYATAIANAAINRLVKTGVDKLLNK